MWNCPCTVGCSQVPVEARKVRTGVLPSKAVTCCCPRLTSIQRSPAGSGAAATGSSVGAGVALGSGVAVCVGLAVRVGLAVGVELGNAEAVAVVVGAVVPVGEAA